MVPPTPKLPPPSLSPIRPACSPLLALSLTFLLHSLPAPLPPPLPCFPAPVVSPLHVTPFLHSPDPHFLASAPFPFPLPRFILSSLHLQTRRGLQPKSLAHPRWPCDSQAPSAPASTQSTSSTPPQQTLQAGGTSSAWRTRCSATTPGGSSASHPARTLHSSSSSATATR